MEEDWHAEQEWKELDTPAVGLGYRGDLFRIDGVLFSADDCPECLRSEAFECGLCAFFSPKTCRLRNDPFLMEEIKTLLRIWWEYQAAQLEHRQALVDTIRSELQTHGRPLHYSVLARMVGDRHPELETSEKSVLMIMVHHPGIFEWVAEGVYQCR